MAKTDQPGLIELHAEKIALALSAVITIVVGYLWVIRSPNVTTEIGTSHTPVPPAEIDATLLEAAEQVASRIENFEPGDPTVDPANKKLEERLRNPLGHETPPSLVPITEGPAERELADGPIGGKELDAMPDLPDLDELDVWIGHELIAAAPPGEGMMMGTTGTVKDATVAHVTAVLDYETMVTTWQEALDGTGTALDIRFTRVVARRQKRLSDGSWSPAEEIETSRPTEAADTDARSAGPPELPAYDDNGRNYPEVRAAIDALAQSGVQRAILHPSHPRVYWPEAKGFGGWMHHLPRTSVSDLKDAILWPDQQPDTSGLSYASRTPTDTGDDTARDGTGMYGPGGGGTGMYGPGGGTGMYGPGAGGTGMYGPGPGAPGAPGGTRTPTQRPRMDAAENRRAQAERAAQQATEALDEADEALRDGRAAEALDLYRRAERLAARADDLDAGAANISGIMQRAKEGKSRARLPMPTRVPPLGNMCQAGKIQFWFHDDTCEPGEVYRYQLRLEACNPLFMSITPGTPAAEAPPMVLATTSEWSEPVTAPRRTEFFLTDATSGSLRFTVFRRTHGQVLAQKVTVPVGDPIGSTESRSYVDPLTRQPAPQPMEVDFSTGYVLVDCDLDRQIAPRGTNRTTAQATLLAPDGSLVIRTVADDRALSRYRELARASREAEQQLEQLAQPPRP
ncbi:MAG: hypothetical protein ACOC95_09450 [Planctomycetota bacterium]